MEYSFSTVYMTIIFCNILLILITIGFQNTKIMIKMGYKLLALFAGFCVLRFLLPFEFPFATNVLLPQWLSRGIQTLRYPYWKIEGYEVSVCTILQGIWLAGTLAGLIFYLINYGKSRYKIIANSLDITDSERHQAILNEVCRERGMKNNFQILATTGIISPMITGVLKPWIMLPDHLWYTDKELYYIFLHETSHHFHHDLIIKHCVSVIAIMYWWNPFSYILLRKMSHILEMRVDDKVTSSDPETVFAYLKCLCDIMDRAMNTPLPKPLFPSFVGIDMVLMKKRFAMLTQAPKKRNKFLTASACLLVAGLYILSYLYIFEGSYVPPEIEDTSLSITENDGYAVLKEDNTYDIYYGTMLIENTESLRFYPTDIRIYTEKEFLNEKE